MGTETTNETSGMLKTVIQGGVIGVLVLVLILNFFERREMRAQAQNMIVAFEEMTEPEHSRIKIITGRIALVSHSI